MKILPYFVLLPLFGAFFIALIHAIFKKKSRIFIEGITVIITLTLFIMSLFLFKKGPGIYVVGNWYPPLGINLLLDGFSAIMISLINLVAFVSALFSINYMKPYTALNKFYSLFLLMVTGMNGILLSGDFFNIFVFIEIASIASYALVGFGNEADELEASFKYMVMGAIASTLVLFSIALLYSQFGNLNIAIISQAIRQSEFNFLLRFSLFLFLTAFAIKAAIIPFHAWLPDAHPAAPAPISAMLSGVFIKTLGVYTIIRILFTVYGFNDSFSLILLVMGAFSIITGGLLALGQTDMKRLLAYSSISQIGFIMLGFGLGTPLGILGGIFHLVSHSIFKSLLFLNSGSIFYRVHSRKFENMGGLNKVMPITATTSMIASLSISGMPPFNGFFSKLIIIIACIQSGQIFFAILAIAGSILTLSYFMKLQKLTFFGKLRDDFKKIKEVPFLMSLSMIILAVLCLATSLLLIPQLREAVLEPAVEAILNPENYIKLVIK